MAGCFSLINRRRDVQDFAFEHMRTSIETKTRREVPGIYLHVLARGYWKMDTQTQLQFTGSGMHYVKSMRHKKEGSRVLLEGYLDPSQDRPVE